MRHSLTALAGTFIAFLMLETAAIAQVTYYSCLPNVERGATYNGKIYWGWTNQGNRLELDPNSLRSARYGMQFTYYLNGQAIEGFTNCRESAWYVGRRRFAATSPAATEMLRYICGSRVSWDW